MQTPSEAYNAITARLRTWGLTEAQLNETCHLLNEFWDAVDTEVRVDELPK